MEFCVVGAGAMGGVYGLKILEAGYPVSFLDINLEHIKAVKEKGFRLSGISGNCSHFVNITEDPAQLENTADIVLFHAHTTGSLDAAKSAALVLKPDGFAITLQNGIGNIEALTEALGKERVIGGISYHSAALVEPGHAEHTNDGATFLGEINGDVTSRINLLCEIFKKAGLSPEVSTDIVSVIWSKFVVNCGINPLCAVSGLRSGEVARNNAAAEMQSRILDEIMLVVDAKGIKLTNENMSEYVKNLARSRYNKPSMQQHIEAGRLTEIDSLNGALVEEAKSLKIKTPYNEALVMMVKAREASMCQLKSGKEPDYIALEAAAQEEIT